MECDWIVFLTVAKEMSWNYTPKSYFQIKNKKKNENVKKSRDVKGGKLRTKLDVLNCYTFKKSSLKKNLVRRKIHAAFFFEVSN